jgi:hypothetical protein
MSEGKTLPFISVTEQGTQNATTTDENLFEC